MLIRSALALALLSLTACQSAEAGILFGRRHQERIAVRSSVRTHSPAPRRVAIFGVPLKATPASGCPGGKCVAPPHVQK